MNRSKKYRDWLLETLKDHDTTVAYLNEAWQESLKGDAESREILSMALKNVAEARQGK